ncbi:hypothetical protein GCWU000342_01739 [Shuttleworthella satelles DSM 14600]|uniref:Uncharacterized protein n=1 Tax=Shuttleworthella satelles DSM 14600 TaxID=626523 RepID=C4GCP4_9FIRM|nr:hypothetical protein GCWU000342_01739 [Shuttleworthia satelles DSM 14600]
MTPRIIAVSFERSIHMMTLSYHMKGIKFFRRAKLLWSILGKKTKQMLQINNRVEDQGNATVSKSSKCYRTLTKYR